MNNMVNLIIKTQYLIEKEIELKSEALEVRLILVESNKYQKEDTTAQSKKDEK